MTRKDNPKLWRRPRRNRLTEKKETCVQRIGRGLGSENDAGRSASNKSRMLLRKKGLVGPGVSCQK